MRPADDSAGSGKGYKIITHPSQEFAERNVFVLTQERAVDRNDIDDIDLLVIDEFYKLDIGDGDDGERAAILNHALYKLHKKSKQIYLLGPSIQGIPDGFGEQFQMYLQKNKLQHGGLRNKLHPTQTVP